MKWAADRGLVVLTQDLDYPALLASTQAKAPSVVVVRAPDLLSSELVDRVIQLLIELEGELKTGAIVSVDTDRSRMRVLPLG